MTHSRLPTSVASASKPQPHTLDHQSALVDRRASLQQSATDPTAEQANSEPLLSLTDISYAIQRQILISHVSFDIAVDETISIIGPNGAGKSTLVKLILGLITPSSGRIVKHKPLQIGYVPQRFSVPAILPLRVQDLLSQANTGRLTPLQQQFIFDKLQLAHLQSQQLHHLSGGETQRVLLARALLEKPNLLILDEPMQGLDPETEAWLYQFIDELPAFLRCAMLVVSHDLHWVMKGSRRVICLNKHICCEGQPSQLAVSAEFQKLFGHNYEQPYLHKPHHCEHHAPSELL